MIIIWLQSNYNLIKKIYKYYPSIKDVNIWLYVSMAYWILCIILKLIKRNRSRSRRYKDRYVGI